MVAGKIIYLSRFHAPALRAFTPDAGHTAEIITFPHRDSVQRTPACHTESANPVNVSAVDIHKLRRCIADGTYKVDADELAHFIVHAIELG